MTEGSYLAVHEKADGEGDVQPPLRLHLTGIHAGIGGEEQVCSHVTGKSPGTGSERRSGGHLKNREVRQVKGETGRGETGEDYIRYQLLIGPK